MIGILRATVILALVAIIAGLAAARGSAEAAHGSAEAAKRSRTKRGAASESSAPGAVPYRLGEETVPNGSFDAVGPRWLQVRPDEGEKLAIVPQGWLVGYQGGNRVMPVAGVDPESRRRCMDFLYGSGSVDLVSPVFDLRGSGTYLLSIWLRSVVNPSAHALRVVIRLLPPEGDGMHPKELTFETIVAAGPPERVWATRTALVAVPGGLTRAEIHLIKDDALIEFLVRDVSLRRIESLPARARIEIATTGLPWSSPPVFLGAVEEASLTLEGSSWSDGTTLEARTGIAAENGPIWEDWQPFVPGTSAGSKTPLHLFARGLPAILEMRARPPVGGIAGKTGSAPDTRSVIFVTVPSKRAASPDVSLISVTNATLPREDALAFVMPDAGSCSEGALAPVRILALEAVRGMEDDLARADAIRASLNRWMPFSAGGNPPANRKSPSPSELLADCRLPTPLFCRGWEADLFTAACLCAGLICRPVSSSAAGDPDGPIEGVEAYSRETGKWVYYDLRAFSPRDPVAAGPKPSVPGGGSALIPPVEGNDGANADLARATPGRSDVQPVDGGRLSAADLAARELKPAAFATDLRWGRRAWIVHDPTGMASAGDATIVRDTTTAEAAEAPIGGVHVDVVAVGGRSFQVELRHSMPGFSRYLVRYGPTLEWREAPADFTWTLVPGDNLLEVRAESALGIEGAVSRVRASVFQDEASRKAPYAGLRPLGGDPHVHTGLGIYGILDPNRPVAVGTPEQAFASARKNDLDWAAVTDSSHLIDDPRTQAWRRASGKALRDPDGRQTFSEWDHLRAVVAGENQPGRFAAFLGLEFSGGGFSSAGGTGQKIVLLPGDSASGYCSSRIQNVGDCPLVEDAYRFARANGGVMIAAAPCPAAQSEDTDWSSIDPIVSLMEIYGGVCETGPGSYREALRRGLFVGAAGGSDSRDASAGRYDRTICWAADVTRDSILSAIRSRRCYWSAAGHLDLAFSIDGSPMGSVIFAAPAISWSVEARGRTAPPFANVDLIRDGVVVASAACRTPSSCTLEGGASESLPGDYYAAVNGADGGRLAVTSPIRVRPAGSR